MNENNLNHNKLVQVENNNDLLMNLKNKKNYISSMSPNFMPDNNGSLSLSGLMSPNTPQMRILSSPLHTLSNNFVNKFSEESNNESVNMQKVDNNLPYQVNDKRKRSLRDLEMDDEMKGGEEEQQQNIKTFQKPLNPDDIPMRTDYGTLEELLAEIGLPSTKATGLYDEITKPPYSYAAMIALSIMVSGMGQLTLSQIYQWISSHFPFYKLGDSGWQNSIRHNLSLNSAFFKGGKSSDGKGHFWRLTPGQELKILKIQAKPSTKNKSKKVQYNIVNNQNRKIVENTGKIADDGQIIQLDSINTTVNTKLMDSIKEDDTLVSSSSSTEHKDLIFSKNKEEEQGAISVVEEEEVDSDGRFKSLKKSKQDYHFGEKYNDILATPVKYRFAPNGNIDGSQTRDTVDNFKNYFNSLKKLNDLDDFNNLLSDTKFMELEQSFQCSFNTSFDSPKLATKLESSPLIEGHSNSKLELKRLSNASQPKISIGRTTTTLVETPRKEAFNDDISEDKYDKVTVGNVMLSRTPLKATLSPFPTFSLVNTNNNINSALQRNTPRWKTPSYDDIFVSPFFKSPRNHQFSNSFFFNEHNTINLNHNQENIGLHRRHSTTDVMDAINTIEKSTESSAKKLEPALLGLKSNGNINEEEDKNKDTSAKHFSENGEKETSQ